MKKQKVIFLLFISAFVLTACENSAEDGTEYGKIGEESPEIIYTIPEKGMYEEQPEITKEIENAEEEIETVVEKENDEEFWE